MKFQTTKKDLFDNLQITQNIVTPRASLPILLNILLETIEGKLRLVTTDLDICISCEYPVEVVESGAITVPGKKFVEIIHELPPGQITITAKKNNAVIIQSENCEFKIMGLPKDEFPKLPEFKDKDAIKLGQAALKEMLNKTSFAISRDEARYVLNGILFKIEQDKINLAATDGRRLAVIEKNTKTKINKPINIIIPSKSISELTRNLKEEGELLLVLGENQVLFDLGAVHIISRLIEGEFPDYRQVVPIEQKDKIMLSRESFLLALKRAAVLSSADYQAAKLEVFKNKLVISKSAPDLGESREELAVEYSGKELAVGFNPAYLIDVLKMLPGEMISFELTDSEKPGVIREPGYLYIVLPMRI
ncbi:MAG: DNA polymerase III subunit beta [Omnitrophica WOR_2 bacterium RIFCSPHIGHO2_02_FULL_45_21]|nr:MAG: DNA polymerase III subunit beta [Omnitrophica WOR_2 bacterium RIFCSPHIGHO2_02_FULL_45_21]